MKTEAKYIVDVMTPNPVSVGPETEIWSAERLALQRSVHDLIVMEGYRLSGVVCRCDLQLASSSEARPVRDFMCPNPITIEDQDTVDTAMDLMTRHEVGCLPVVDWAGLLRGVVTRRDLAAAGAIFGMGRCATCGATHGLSAGQGTLCVRCTEFANRAKFDLRRFAFQGGRAA